MDATRKELKHLLLATTEDPFDQRSWSGIPWSLRKALERRVEQVTVFRPSPPRRTPVAVALRALYGPRKRPLWITKATLKQNATELKAAIERTRPDAVLSISSQCIAYLEGPGVPVFLFSDAPYQAFCEAYGEWETEPVRLPEFAEEEASAARRLDGLCFGSQWACDEARRLYGLQTEDAETLLHVTPLGANWLPEVPAEEIGRRIDARSWGEMELLFVGRDWERKGGPLAVEIARLLREAGRAVRLHVVGCQPELGAAAGAEGFVTLHGLLRQSDPLESAKLAELYLCSQFLLVPTRAECFGIVFAEAQAFGLPAVSRAVHALPSIVEDGVTGLLFARDATAQDYVRRIQELAGDPARYRVMAHQARTRFEQSLNWDYTAERMVDAMRAAFSQMSRKTQG